MTNIEAIKYLEYLQDNYTRKGAPMCQAVETAIAALNPKPIRTNADRIRKMTDEELAEFLSKVKSYCIKISCGECDFYDAEASVDDIICSPLYWLKQEVKGDAEAKP